MPTVPSPMEARLFWQQRLKQPAPRWADVIDDAPETTPGPQTAELARLKAVVEDLTARVLSLEAAAARAEAIGRGGGSAADGAVREAKDADKDVAVVGGSVHVSNENTEREKQVGKPTMEEHPALPAEETAARKVVQPVAVPIVEAAKPTVEETPAPPAEQDAVKALAEEWALPEEAQSAAEPAEEETPAPPTEGTAPAEYDDGKEAAKILAEELVVRDDVPLVGKSTVEEHGDSPDEEQETAEEVQQSAEPTVEKSPKQLVTEPTVEEHESGVTELQLVAIQRDELEPPFVLVETRR